MDSAPSSRIDLPAFEALARARRATRHFRPGPPTGDLLDVLTERAGWAPSGYILHPTHCGPGTGPAGRAQLRRACLIQPHIADAPAVDGFTVHVRVAFN